MLTEAELLSLLSKPIADKKVRATLEKLGAIKRQKAEDGAVYRFKSAGVEVTEEQDRVESVQLNKKGGGFTEYAGEQPLGLKFAMPREEVQQLVGEPDGGDDESDVWDRGAYTLTVQYDAKSRVANVLLQAF